MPRSYSSKIVERVNKANPEKIGVKLGLLCIKHSIPVATIADRFKVAKPTVYSWFSGDADPIASLEARMRKLVEFLEQQSASE